MSEPLPLLSGPPTERRDAARNRAALLAAAEELIATQGPDGLTMEALARRAGVGKGTVFRRFGSKAGLMATLLDQAETEWQRAVLSGPPPLGPGAPALERLLAFGESRIHTNLAEAALIDAAGRTWTTNRAVLGFAGAHVRYLLTELGTTGDLRYLATALIAPLSLPALDQLRYGDRRATAEIIAGWQDLVRRVVDRPAASPRRPAPSERAGRTTWS